MYRMLSCFDLRPGVSVSDLRNTARDLSDYLRQSGLLESSSPIGRRQRHPVMDTDAERDHEFFFIMSFADRAQCDRAVEYMYRHEGTGDEVHTALYSKIANPVFICWEDLGEDA